MNSPFSIRTGRIILPHLVDDVLIHLTDFKAVEYRSFWSRFLFGPEKYSACSVVTLIWGRQVKLFVFHDEMAAVRFFHAARKSPKSEFFKFYPEAAK